MMRPFQPDGFFSHSVHLWLCQIHFDAIIFTVVVVTIVFLILVLDIAELDELDKFI